MTRIKKAFSTVVLCGVCVGVLWSYFTLVHWSRLPSFARKEALEFLELVDFPTKLGRDDKYRWNNNGQLDFSENEKFAPAFNLTEYKWYLEIISEFKRSCETFNISYMVSYGSALGAFRHHGFVPWDDDFDVLVNSSQKQVFKDRLRSVPGYQLYSKDHYQWKFYSDDIGVETNFHWKWPNIDIFFFDEDATHFYDVTDPNWPGDFHLRSDILPFRSGIFENLVLPVPKNMEAYLNKIYSMQDSCVSSAYNHKKEMNIVETSIPCHKLFNVYPMVHRFQVDNIP